MTKIIVYKQFTTKGSGYEMTEDTVSSMTKIIVYKQFTTKSKRNLFFENCFQYDKDNSL